MGQRKLKTPQVRSSEEAEAEPTESEVAEPVVFMHFYSFHLHFVYNLDRADDSSVRFLSLNLSGFHIKLL